MKADLRKGILKIAPLKKKDKSVAKVSPRSLWDAVSRSGYTPTKIVTPKKTYTKRPKEKPDNDEGDDEKRN